MSALPLPDLPPLIRARTLRQPYAGLVAAVPSGDTVGLKSIETRKSRTKLGLLVICAGLTTDWDAWRRASAIVEPWTWATLKPSGVALCLVDIIEARPLVPEDEPRAWIYKAGLWAWVIGRTWAFTRPFKQRGMPGQWLIPREQILEAMG